MMTPMRESFDDTDTVASLANEIEELSSKVSMLLHFVDEQFDACPCEHCGHVNPRKHMLAVFGLYRGTDGKDHPESSRWFCGYCVWAACVNLCGDHQECRDRIGKWFAVGYGREFLREMDSHFAHLGPGADRAPVAEQLRRDFAAEIQAAARRWLR